MSTHDSETLALISLILVHLYKKLGEDRSTQTFRDRLEAKVNALTMRVNAIDNEVHRKPD